jgi:hypothetical protein
LPGQPARSVLRGGRGGNVVPLPDTEGEVDGKPAVILTLLEVNFCPTCQTFHGTKEPHTCIR